MDDLQWPSARSLLEINLHRAHSALVDALKASSDNDRIWHVSQAQVRIHRYLQMLVRVKLKPFERMDTKDDEKSALSRLVQPTNIEAIDD